MRIDYLVVAKHFEIPATGALLLTSRAAIPYAAVGFRDGVNYLADDQNNIETTLDYVSAPENLAHVNRMRAAGQKLVREKHMVAHRARLLHMYVRSGWQEFDPPNNPPTQLYLPPVARNRRALPPDVVHSRR